MDASTSVTDVATRLRQNLPPNVVRDITWSEEAWEYELSGKVLIGLVKNEMLKEYLEDALPNLPRQRILVEITLRDLLE